VLLWPDALLPLGKDHGGQSRVGEDGYIHGAPEFVAEVAAGTAAYDLHQKKAVYLAHAAREYLVGSVEDQRLDWWELREGQYVTIPLGQDGLARSRIFPGLWLDARALLAGDLAAVLAGVGRGLPSD
jgi:Uma2 family endonuclease